MPYTDRTPITWRFKRAIPNAKVAPTVQGLPRTLNRPLRPRSAGDLARQLLPAQVAMASQGIRLSLYHRLLHSMPLNALDDSDTLASTEDEDERSTTPWLPIRAVAHTSGQPFAEEACGWVHQVAMLCCIPFGSPQQEAA
eukprot:9467276-Pyramimonas_sp.AAC.1